MKIVIVVGARPNFMKISPIIKAIEKYTGVEYKLVHTGQHYDDNMSEVFFEELEIRQPDINFDVGSMSHANQTAMIMTLFEAYCLDEKPDIVLVIGDVNSTLACAVVVSKLEGVKLVHVEAGERSFDRRMPEEINRIVTDVLSDYFFCATEKAKQNLLSEGINKNKIFVVGNVIVDNLLYCRDNIKNYKKHNYILATIHRASNTDNKSNLEIILSSLYDISKKVPVIFPLHPRTKQRIESFKLDKYLNNIVVVDPYNYFKFVESMMKSLLVITDSGGVQVETTVLDIPCLTIRENTEWEFTLTEGTNTLIGDINKNNIIKKSMKIISGDRKYKNLSTKNSELLDGKASKRIVNILTSIYKNERR